MPTPVPVPAPTPMPEPAPEPAPPAVDVEAVRAEVGAAITKAFAAIRSQDFRGAKRALDGIVSRALDDQQATDRVQRWQQFVTYAQAYPDYRDKALASAASTAATYDFGGRQIGVVEITDDEFIYRDSRRPGRNLHAPRDAIPPDIEQGLVRAWFAADGRAANHLFLGAAALARREPDLGVARREWQAAAAGGEPDGRLLLGILEDPVVRGR